jgi:hypothetical protein
MGTPGSFPLYDYSLDPFTEECINPYDLDTLVGWSDTWQMEFNVSKCAIMQTTNKKSKTDFPYKMKGVLFPGGTPDVTWEHLEASPSTTTLWILLLRNASIHILVVPSMP